MVMPLMASGALPELLSVATWAAVVAPVTAVELSEAGVSVAVTTETAEKLAVTLCGALMVTVVEALLALATLPVQFRHFYTFAAKVMRMILIDHARESQTQMRGGGFERVPLSDDLLWVNIGSPELLDLNRALDELGALDAYKVQLVELRYFLGCTAEETASLMQVSKSTVDRDLRFTKSWLYRRIHPGVEDAVRL